MPNTRKYSVQEIMNATYDDVTGVVIKSVVGNVANDAVDSGNSVKVGGKANTGVPTSVAAGDRVDAWYGINGQAIIGAHTATVADGSADSASAVLISPGGTWGEQAVRGRLFNGATWDRERTSNVFKTFTALGTGVEVTVWTPAAGKSFRLMRAIVTSSVAGDITFRDNTAGAIILIVPVLAGAPVVIDLGNGILSGAINRVLTLDAPGAGTLSGFVGGTEE